MPLEGVQCVPTRDLNYIGSYHAGIPYSMVWRRLQGEEWVVGRVDSQGNHSGQRNTSTYHIINVFSEPQDLKLLSCISILPIWRISRRRLGFQIKADYNKHNQSGTGESHHLIFINRFINIFIKLSLTHKTSHIIKNLFQGLKIIFKQ